MKLTEQINKALEGVMSEDANEYIHNEAVIRRNAVTWLSQLLQERNQMVEALKRERDDAMMWDGITVVNRINKILKDVGELE